MKAIKDTVVSISYTLTVDGRTADSAGEDKPLEYIHGGHMLIPGLEEALEGREPGDAVTVTVGPEEAYGDYDPKKKFDIPKESFAIDGIIREDLLAPGTIVPMLNSAGAVVQGTVVEVKGDDVTMDFNHPMAGKVLNFTAKVISVRAATEKELKEGLHGEYLPQDECGCGCHHHHHHGEGCCHGKGHHDGHCHHDEGRHGEGCCHGEGHCHHDGE